jgi:hypothetical protein
MTDHRAWLANVATTDLQDALRQRGFRVSLELASVAPAAVPATPAQAGEKNITVAEAARRLGMSPSYIYKNEAALPFVGRIGRRRVCDAAAVERYRQQTGAGHAR